MDHPAHDMAGLTPGFKRRRYDLDELVRMRSGLPIVCCYIAKLNKHPHIVAIMNVPNEVFNDPERHHCCTTNSLRGLKKQRKASISRRKNIGAGLSEGENQTVLAAGSASGSQRVGWKFRQRNSSDHSSQPHSAPTGLEAQQSENFKRFYRAVVSPTHVRVTAGGRIVPNTRVTRAHQVEWNSDKQIFEPRRVASDIDIKPPRVPHLPPSTAFTPGFPQPLPGGFLPAYNHGPQHNPHPLTTITTQALGNLGGNSHAPVPSGESGTSTLHPSNIPQPIKISHPSQFDHSKPFLFNGQLLYPVSRGHMPPFPLPVPMTGNPTSGQGALPPAGFFMPQPLMSMGQPAAVNTSLFDQNQTVTGSNTTQEVENVTSYNPYLPLSGHVSVADITKVQIEGFRSHLNFINDQLANAQSPIDTQYLEGQRTDLVAIIEKMETMLTIQLAYDRKQSASAYPNGVIESGSALQLAQNTANGDARKDCGKDIGTTSTTLSSGGPVTHYTSTTSAPRSTKSTRSEVDQGTDGTSTAKAPIRSEPTVHKSKLTAAAAMAPPFQPRTQAMVAANSFSGISTGSSTYSKSFNIPENGAKWTVGSGQMAHSPTITGTIDATLPRPPFTHSTSIYTQNDGSVAFPRLQPAHGQFTPINDLAIPTISPAAVPYLVGTLPQGQGSEIKVTDLHYPRPLADDELRARYLYWGRAPRSAYSGLPKFDGKDFYPPSPVKEASQTRPGFPYNSTRDRRTTPAALNLERLFTASSPGPSPKVDGFSVRPRSSADHHDTANPKSKLANQPPVKYGNKVTPLEDFSKLFLEQNTSHSSLSNPLYMRTSQSNVDFGKEENVAYTSLGKSKTDIDNKDDDHDSKSVNSWGSPVDFNKIVVGDAEMATGTKLRHGVGNTSHMVATGSSKRDDELNFLGRAESSSSSEKHAAFLQNMLKSTTQVPMAAPALRTVSSATARGYLPQYRGFATASLTPAMVTIPGTGHYGEHTDLKPGQPSQSAGGTVPVSSASLLGENKPLKYTRSPRPTRPTGDALDAEGYMRYLTKKAEDDKKVMESGWNVNTTGIGPIMGPNW